MSDAQVQTGALSGVWASLHPRRQALHATADALVLDAWQQDTAGIAFAALVARYRRQAAGQDAEHRYQVALSLILGVLLARTMLRTRTALQLSQERAYEAGREAAGEHGAPADGTSSGVQGARVGPLLAAALAATARRMARALAASDGAAGAQASLLRQLARKGLDILTATDVLVSNAYGRGLRRGFADGNVSELAWVTVGDGAVCATCDARAEESPYPAAAAPELPAHPNCRCTYAPA